MNKLIYINKHRIVVASLILFAPILYYTIWLSAGLEPFPWDGNWYRSIAEHGYQFNGDIFTPNNTAFLPGYPLVIYIFSLVTGDDLILAQFLATFFLYCAGAIFWYKYIDQKLGVTPAMLFIIILPSNPYSIYFLNGYSETLFFALTGCFFYLHAKKYTFLSSMIVSFALVTRPHGVALAAFFMLSVLINCYVILEKDKAGSVVRIFNSVLAVLRYTPIVISAPALLTIYHYLMFDDAALYINSLAAWAPDAVKLSIIDIFKNIYPVGALEFAQYNIGGLRINYAEPVNFAFVYIFLQLLALAVLAVVGFKSELRDLILFLLILSLFSLVNASYQNIGRHFVMLLSIPALISLYFKWVANFRSGSVKISFFGKIGVVAPGLLFATMFAIGMFYFCLYAIRQINGYWVS